MKLQIAFFVFGLIGTALTANIEPKVWKNLEEAETTNVIVSFTNANTKAALSRVESLRLTSRDAKLNTVYAILKDHADIVQLDVTSMLKKTEAVKKHVVNQFWITGQLWVQNIDKETVELLGNHPDVESVTAEFFIPLLPAIEEEYTQEYNRTDSGILDDPPQWGVAAVRAPEVWARGVRGQGVVVGVLDTGAVHTHQGLSTTYRGTATDHQYHWFDPSGQSVGSPTDPNGHGTHCIGSISGTTNGIGVAPSSNWVACRGCAGAACSNAHLLACGQWMACPTNTAGGAPNCPLAPRIVNNSWGGGRGSTFYDAVINAWLTAGIVPFFSAGNSGPGCNTVISPSDRPGAVSIGSTLMVGGNPLNQGISGFSSRGIGGGAPALRKPDVSAPGSAIVSSGHQAPTQYRTLSGTSMAAPHAAGVAALYLSVRPNASVAEVIAALRQGTVAINTVPQTCGGTPDSGRPNNTVGDGALDATAVVPA